MSAAAASSPYAFLHVIIHSTCMHDIDQAKEFGFWASTESGNIKLKEYFTRANTTVILYFTKFGSGKFSGIAKMVTVPLIRRDLKEYETPKWQEEGKWGKELLELKWIFETQEESYVKELEGVNVLDCAIIPEDKAKLVLAKFVRSSNVSARDFSANPLLEGIRVYSGAKRGVDMTSFFRTAEEPSTKRPKTG